MKRVLPSHWSVVIASAAIVAAGAFATLAEAHPAGGRMRAPRAQRGGESTLLGGIERLDLKDEQRDKLRQIRRGSLETMAQKRVAIAQARMDLQDLLMDKDATTSALKQAHDKLSKAQMDLQAAAFDLRLQAREVLTPAQRDELRKSVRKAPRRMGMLLPPDEPAPPDDDLGFLDESEAPPED